MSARYEWAPFVTTADIVPSQELRELSEDDSDLWGDVVGVTVDTGSDGIMLYGPRGEAIAWCENLLQRLRAGEGSPLLDADEADDEGGEVVDGEVVEPEVDFRSPQVQREIRAGLRELTEVADDE